MGRASGGSNAPQWIRSNILDFLSAMSENVTFCENAQRHFAESSSEKISQ